MTKTGENIISPLLKVPIVSADLWKGGETFHFQNNSILFAT